MSQLKLVDPQPDLRARKKCPELPLLADTVSLPVPAQDRSLSYSFPLAFSALEMEAIRRTS